MKNERNELLEFLAGIGMLIAGLVIFSQKVIITTGFFGGLSLGGFNLSSGIVVIPLIMGIVWLFVNYDSFGAKLLVGAGILIIIVSVILSTQIHLRTITLFEWIIMLVLLFGGLGLVLRSLFVKRRLSSDSRQSKIEELEKEQFAIEEEIKRLKRNQ